jgi:hypothetical protein
MTWTTRSEKPSSETTFTATLPAGRIRPCGLFGGPRLGVVTLLLCVALTAFGSGKPVRADEQAKAAEFVGDRQPRLILVTLDGLRWEEVFRGADERFMNRDDGGVRDVAALKSQFWDEDPEVRRQKLLPFLWSELVPQGQLWGNQDMECQVRVTNGRYFSYPGYHELLAGYADPRIDSNAKQHNPNITVLEWIHRQDGFEGSVQAFCSWDVFPYILNSPRSGIPVNAGWQPLGDLGENSIAPMLNEVADNLPRVWDGVRYDYFTFQGAMLALKHDRPRVLYVSLGETDDWAHEGRYDLYLESARRNDQYLRELWHFVQNDPDYAGRTNLVIATDHGRGDTPSGWKSHSASIPGSESIWIGCLGPDVAPRGVRANLKATQSQVAATSAQLLGFDYCAAVAEAAQPLNLK